MSFIHGNIYLTNSSNCECVCLCVSTAGRRNNESIYFIIFYTLSFALELQFGTHTNTETKRKRATERYTFIASLACDGRQQQRIKEKKVNASDKRQNAAHWFMLLKSLCFLILIKSHTTKVHSSAIRIQIN